MADAAQQTEKPVQMGGFLRRLIVGDPGVGSLRTRTAES